MATTGYPSTNYEKTVTMAMMVTMDNAVMKAMMDNAVIESMETRELEPHHPLDKS